MPNTTIKILIVRLSSLGDVVHNLILINDLHVLCRKLGYTCTIDWVVEKPFNAILEPYQGVRQIICMHWRTWRKQLFKKNTWQAMHAFYKQLRQTNYDLIIDSQGLIKSAIVANIAKLNAKTDNSFLNHLKQRIGYANKTQDSSHEKPATWMYSKSYTMPYKIHAVDRARLLILEHFKYALNHSTNAIKNKDINLNLPALHNTSFLLTADELIEIDSYTNSTTDTNQVKCGFNIHAFNTQQTTYLKDYLNKNYAVCLHGSSSIKKYWASNNWLITIVNILDNHPHTYIYLPHSNLIEENQADNLLKSLEEHPLKNQVLKLPRLSLKDMYDLVAQSKIVIGLDTGLTHLASSLNKPTIAIYAKNISYRVGAYWHDKTIAIYEPNTKLSCLKVLEAIKKLM